MVLPIPLLGLLAGIFLGVSSAYVFPSGYSAYVAVAILACTDSVLGGIKSSLHGQFHLGIFLSGFLGNGLLAMVLVYFGDKLNIQLSLAAIVVFGSRFFQNFAEIRRFILNQREKKDKIHSEEQTENGC